jgi:hypothetical protein
VKARKDKREVKGEEDNRRIEDVGFEKSETLRERVGFNGKSVCRLDGLYSSNKFQGLP